MEGVISPDFFSAGGSHIDVDTTSSSDIHVNPDNVEDVPMDVGPDMSQGLTASTSNTSNTSNSVNSSNSSTSSTSSHYSSSEEPSVTQKIRSSLPANYKVRSILGLAMVVTICKECYNAYATANGKTLSSCPDYEQSYEFLQTLGQDTRNELHDLVDQDKFAALVFHGTSSMSVLTRKPD